MALITYKEHICIARAHEHQVWWRNSVQVGVLLVV